MLAYREGLVVSRTGVWPVDIGKPAATCLVPCPDAGGLVFGVVSHFSLQSVAPHRYNLVSNLQTNKLCFYDNQGA